MPSRVAWDAERGRLFPWYQKSYVLTEYLVINLVGIAAVTGYLASEYIYPWIRRRWSSSRLAGRLGRPGLVLTEYEEAMAEGLVLPGDLQDEPIGGLKDLIDTLESNLHLLDLQSTAGPFAGLLDPPIGILLYGPPGCGKTMLARSIARRANCAFLNVSLAAVFDKWVGETEKRVEAVFSLARKLAPTVVFFDEIDAVTRNRGAVLGDAGWTSSLKALLLSEWDGLATRRPGDPPVVVLGATNRPEDIDEAFLRRMPLRLEVPLPDAAARTDILRRILSGVGGSVDYAEVAGECEGLSGAELRELCRRAALQASREGKWMLTTSDLLKNVFI